MGATTITPSEVRVDPAGRPPPHGGTHFVAMTSDVGGTPSNDDAVDVMGTFRDLAHGSNPLQGEIARAEDVKLGFKDYTVTLGGNALLKDTIGYVRKGGLTAVLGPSASGKSVLLKSLTGYTRDLIGSTSSGSVFLDGAQVQAGQHQNQVAFQPQANEHLIGVLTVRESVSYALKLKKPRMGADARRDRVDEVLSNLGLVECQDTQIGTIYKRGISGGQQRRVALAIELVYSPDVLCLDEPTSGLDTTTAINTVTYLRSQLEASQGRAGCLMTIHQPNAELLSLFDDVILLVNGGCVYTGTVAGAAKHFNELEGKDIIVPGVPVTETSLRLADTTFNHHITENYPARYGHSTVRADLATKITAYQAERQSISVGQSFGDHIVQFWTLVMRLLVVAKRDLTLFYVQYFLSGMYGFLIGVIFFQRKHEIGNGFNDLVNSILWIGMLNLFVFVFKSYYNATQYPVLTHERSNSMYNPVSGALSELLVLMLAVPGYILPVLIAFFMVGFPAESFPFMILFGFVACFTAEAIPGIVAQFTRKDASKALMASQAVLLLFFVFAAGLFIREDDVPSYWKWLQTISIFHHSIKAITMGCFEFLELDCPPPSIVNGALLGYQANVSTGGYGSCVTLQATYPCDVLDSGFPNGCKVDGHTAITILNGFETDKFESLGYVFAIGIVLRLLGLFLQVFPPDLLVNTLFSWTATARNEIARNATLTDWFAPGTSLTPAQRQSREVRSVSTPSVLSFRNIKVRIEKKLLVKPKAILDDVSGVVTGGRLCALMGPSGSGKTTLLNALSGRALYAEVDGQIFLDGHELTKRHFAYVPQYDAINPNFTVRETLTYAVRLRCADGWADMDERVQELIEIVGLDHVENYRAGLLTGGQLKLLSVAIGLVQRPQVLYLDEPTTGLDSTAASVVMEYLSAIAKTGVVTLLTVHQPSKSVYDLIDDVILLASDGTLAFSGPTTDAVSHFSAPPFQLEFSPQDNPADILIEAVSSEASTDKTMKTETAVQQQPTLSQISDAFMASEHSKKLSAMLDRTEENTQNVDDVPIPTTWTRLVVLVDKISRLYWRDPGAYLYYAIVSTLFAVFLSTLYFDLDHTTSGIREIRSVIFFSLWMTGYFLPIIMPLNCQERDEAVRMVASSHCTQVEWGVAQFIAQLPYTFAVNFIVAVFFHFLPNVNNSADVFAWMVLNLWLLHMMLAAVMWNVIETVLSPMLATTASLSVLGVFFLFAGFFIQVPDLVPVIQWIPFTLGTKYSFSGIQYAYFHGVDFVDSATNGTIVSGDEILDSALDIRYSDPARYWYDLLILLAFLVAFRVLHIIMFWKHTKDVGRTLRGQKSFWEKDICRDICGI